MAVMTVNFSVRPDGLVPTLLVFGALPLLGLPTDSPTLSTIKRAVGLRNATAAISKHRASRQVRAALRTRNGLDVSSIHKTPIGSPVLVYRPEKGKSEGSFSVLEIQCEDVTVRTGKGTIKFRSTVVRPYQTDDEREDDTVSRAVPSYSGGSGSKSIMTSTNTKAPGRVQKTPFEASLTTQSQGLQKRGVFTFVLESAAKGHRTYGSRFMNSIKNMGKPNAVDKSRFAVQAYNDFDHGYIIYTPMFQRVCQRLLLALCAMDKTLSLFTRDDSQAYVQSKTPIQHVIFVRHPDILKLPSETILRVDRPLNGILEAGLHWFGTYHNHHKLQLNLLPAVHDLCFLFTKNGISVAKGNVNIPRGFTCLQTNNSASAGNPAFIKPESMMSRKLYCKSSTILAEGSRITFNVAATVLTEGIYQISQHDHVRKLETVAKIDVDRVPFMRQRARGAYISAADRPDLMFGFAQASQITEPATAAVKALNLYITKAKENAQSSLKFVPIDINSVKLIVFSNASLAFDPDLTSQLGYIGEIADESGGADVLHFSSQKSKRVTRNVLAAEMFAAVHTFEFVSTLRATLSNILGFAVPLILFTDSKSLSNSVGGLNPTTEKRLLIDLFMLRGSYELRELTDVARIPGAKSPADGHTKRKDSVHFCRC